MTTRSPRAGEERVAVIGGEESRHIEAGGSGAGERVGRDHRAGVVLAAVDAVGVGGERMNAGRAAEAECQAGEELGVSPATAIAR